MSQLALKGRPTRSPENSDGFMFVSPSGGLHADPEDNLQCESY